VGKGARRRPRRAGRAQKVRRDPLGPQGKADYTVELLRKTNTRLLNRLHRVELLYAGARALLLGHSEHMTEFLPDPMGSLGLADTEAAELRFHWLKDLERDGKWLRVEDH